MPVRLNNQALLLGSLCPEVLNLEQELWAILHTYVSRGFLTGNTVLTQLINLGQTQRREL